MLKTYERLICFYRDNLYSNLILSILKSKVKSIQVISQFFIGGYSSMKKYVYYQIHIFTAPETEKHLGRLLSFYAKSIIKEVVSMSWQQLNTIPMEAVKEFYRQNKKQKCIYVDQETYEKWKQLPRPLKQQAIYLINQKLMEVEL